MAEESSLRERLIDIGEHLVLTEGSASSGLREIARRAGVSHGAPRRHFPTHRTLLAAIARRGFEDLRARFEAAVAGGTTPRDRLAALTRVYLGYALERRAMFELMFRHDLLDSTRLRDSTLPLFERIVELVAHCRAERNTARPGPPPTVTAAALWSNLHGIAQLRAWGSLQLSAGPPASDGHCPDGSRLDRLVAAVLDAHLGPVGPSHPSPERPQP
ncbi:MULTISPECIES: TetR/AcrR family transcriptional regulator [Streptomyces]|uniref:TetR/AcrR family transcriptional regulator n=1 Tax=Streptomyces TaxID=1883 RepID=UPI0004C055A7|nr:MULTISPECIES: TetR/AcrR family transcriptional regulator [Streptomyces]